MFGFFSRKKKDEKTRKDKNASGGIHSPASSSANLEEERGRQRDRNAPAKPQIVNPNPRHSSLMYNSSSSGSTLTDMSTDLKSTSAQSKPDSASTKGPELSLLDDIFFDLQQRMLSESPPKVEQLDSAKNLSDFSLQTERTISTSTLYKSYKLSASSATDFSASDATEALGLLQRLKNDDLKAGKNDSKKSTLPKKKTLPLSPHRSASDTAIASRLTERLASHRPSNSPMQSPQKLKKSRKQSKNSDDSSGTESEGDSDSESELSSVANSAAEHHLKKNPPRLHPPHAYPVQNRNSYMRSASLPPAPQPGITITPPVEITPRAPNSATERLLAQMHTASRGAASEIYMRPREGSERTAINIRPSSASVFGGNRSKSADRKSLHSFGEPKRYESSNDSTANEDEPLGRRLGPPSVAGSVKSTRSARSRSPAKDALTFGTENYGPPPDDSIQPIHLNSLSRKQKMGELTIPPFKPSANQMRRTSSSPNVNAQFSGNPSEMMQMQQQMWAYYYQASMAAWQQQAMMMQMNPAQMAQMQQMQMQSVPQMTQLPPGMTPQGIPPGIMPPSVIPQQNPSPPTLHKSRSSSIIPAVPLIAKIPERSENIALAASNAVGRKKSGRYK